MGLKEELADWNLNFQSARQGRVARIPRDAEPLLRSSGKTSLARHLFPQHPYRNLERPDLRQFASADPLGFLGDLRQGAVIDEVQRVPELLSWLQDLVDQDPLPGRFVLSGSQQFGVRRGLSQSLAGRVGLLELFPFSSHELAGVGQLPAGLDALLVQGAVSARARPRPRSLSLVWERRGHPPGEGCQGMDQRVSRVNPLVRLASIKLAGEVACRPQVVAGDNLGAAAVEATRKLSHPSPRTLFSTEVL